MDYFEPFVGGGALFFHLRGGKARPFLKWAGGKRQLLGDIRKLLPPGCDDIKRLDQGDVVVLGDANLHLVRAYRGVRDSCEDVIRLLRMYPRTRQFFEELRGCDRIYSPDGASDVEHAAWLLYLNRSCFNGLYRENSSGRFNVPYDPASAKRPICDDENLRACAEALRGVSILHMDFASTARRAQPGDLVYFDPPYAPLSATSSFTSYTKRGFDAKDQLRLRDVALDLKRQGVHVLLSNSGAPLVEALYRDGFEMVPVQARRAINCKGGRRGPVKEYLIR